MGVIKFLTNTGLFRDQSDEFFETLKGLAEAADAARRGGQNAQSDQE